MALTILANCGWTHASEDVVEGFAAANGVDLVDRVQGEPLWDAEGGSPMRDDLFQFLADQEEGGRPGSAAFAPSRPNAAPKCGRSFDKIKARQRTERQQPKPCNVSIMTRGLAAGL